MNKITESRINKFLKNASKLDMDVHTQTHDEVLGTIRLQRPASWRASGKRLYSISSKVVHSGSYTAAGLRRALTAIA